MRHITSRSNSEMITAIDSGVSKTNFTHRDEIFKHITIAYVVGHMTVTIDRIVYQDKKRNLKNTANLSMTIETIGYTRINTANGMPEHIAPQRFYKRFTSLVALQIVMLTHIQRINEKMNIGIR